MARTTYRTLQVLGIELRFHECHSSELGSEDVVRISADLSVRIRDEVVGSVADSDDPETNVFADEVLEDLLEEGDDVI